MKLSELVAALSAELIRDGDAEIAAISCGTLTPGAVFCDRHDGSVAVMFRESDETITKRTENEVRQRVQEEMRRREVQRYGISGVASTAAGTATGRVISGLNPTIDKHTFKVLYERAMGGPSGV